MTQRQNSTVTVRAPRRRWVLTAAAVSLTSLALVGCSGGPPAAVAQHSAAGPTVSPAASRAATVDVAAVAAVRRAVTLTTALRSYAFRASQQLTGGAAAQQTTLIGRATRPGALTYTLTVGGQTQQVINVAGRTYLRLPAAPWKALAKPASTVDPVASLLPLLTALTHPTLTGRTLTGLVPASALTAAGLAPAGTTTTASTASTVSAASTPVTFTLNPAGQVTALSVRIVVNVGAKTLTVFQNTTFSLFNAAPAITAPGNIT